MTIFDILKYKCFINSHNVDLSMSVWRDIEMAHICHHVTDLGMLPCLWWNISATTCQVIILFLGHSPL